MNSLVSGLADTCPNLEEIGFRLDETVVALPIDELFERSKYLNSLHLRFDVPRSLVILNKDPEELTETEFKEKKLISKITYSKLRKFKCEFNHEGLFKSWVDLPQILQHA